MLEVCIDGKKALFARSEAEHLAYDLLRVTCEEVSID